MNDYAEPLINLKRVTKKIEDTLMKRPNADIEPMLKEAESCVDLIREWSNVGVQAHNIKISGERWICLLWRRIRLLFL